MGLVCICTAPLQHSKKGNNTDVTAGVTLLKTLIVLSVLQNSRATQHLQQQQQQAMCPTLPVLVQAPQQQKLLTAAQQLPAPRPQQQQQQLQRLHLKEAIAPAAAVPVRAAVTAAVALSRKAGALLGSGISLATVSALYAANMALNCAC